jgi:hypothetical protein
VVGAQATTKHDFGKAPIAGKPVLAYAKAVTSVQPVVQPVLQQQFVQPAAQPSLQQQIVPPVAPPVLQVVEPATPPAQTFLGPVDTEPVVAEMTILRQPSPPPHPPFPGPFEGLQSLSEAVEAINCYVHPHGLKRAEVIPQLSINVTASEGTLPGVFNPLPPCQPDCAQYVYVPSDPSQPNNGMQPVIGFPQPHCKALSKILDAKDSDEMEKTSFTGVVPFDVPGQGMKLVRFTGLDVAGSLFDSENPDNDTEHASLMRILGATPHHGHGPCQNLPPEYRPNLAKIIGVPAGSNYTDCDHHCHHDGGSPNTPPPLPQHCCHHGKVKSTKTRYPASLSSIIGEPCYNPFTGRPLELGTIPSGGSPLEAMLDPSLSPENEELNEITHVVLKPKHCHHHNPPPPPGTPDMNPHHYMRVFNQDARMCHGVLHEQSSLAIRLRSLHSHVASLAKGCGHCSSDSSDSDSSDSDG